MGRQLKKAVDMLTGMLEKLKRDPVFIGRDRPTVPTVTTRTSAATAQSFTGAGRAEERRRLSDEQSRNASLTELRRQHQEAKRKAYGR